MKINSTRTSALSLRIGAQTNQSVDLNKWIFNHLPILESNRVLELCCGTGAQTKYFSDYIKSGAITCVDINPSTIQANKDYVRDPKILYIASPLDDFKKYAKNKYDIIFCAYGFYYSKNPKGLHKELRKKLNNMGRFILSGPVLGNNIELYRIISNIGCKIPKPVTYSSELFMLEFLQEFLTSYESVTFERVENKINYSSPEALLAYWKNTTFYTPGFDSRFIFETKRCLGRKISITKSLSFLQGKGPK